jgi:futalosine hydrolase
VHDLLLLCATEGEASLLAAQIDSPQETLRLGKRTVSGFLSGVPCRLVFTGIGMVNAASELTRQLEAERPSLSVQFGIAGAYPPCGLPLGSVVFATEEIYGEVGVLTPEGWHPADLMGFPLLPGDPPRFNRFPLDPGLVERAAAVCDGARGPFLTLSQCTGVRSLADELYRRFEATCENMEGAAAAHVCALYGVPFLEVRGVSNMVENRDRSRWNIPLAAKVAQEAVRKLVENIDAVLESENA